MPPAIEPSSLQQASSCLPYPPRSDNRRFLDACRVTACGATPAPGGSQVLADLAGCSGRSGHRTADCAQPATLVVAAQGEGVGGPGARDGADLRFCRRGQLACRRTYSAKRRNKSTASASRWWRSSPMTADRAVRPAGSLLGFGPSGGAPAGRAGPRRNSGRAPPRHGRGSCLGERRGCPVTNRLRSELQLAAFHAATGELRAPLDLHLEPLQRSGDVACNGIARRRTITSFPDSSGLNLTNGAIQYDA